MLLDLTPCPCKLCLNAVSFRRCNPGQGVIFNGNGGKIEFGMALKKF